MRDNLTFGESDLAVAFYDAAVDFERASFEMIAKRVFGPDGLSNLSPALEQECRKMYDLAHVESH